MNLSHAEAQALISARLDGPLDPVANRALAAHLATCDACHAFNSSARSLVSGLQEMPHQPPSLAVSRGVLEYVNTARPGWQKMLVPISGSAFPAFSAVAATILIIVIASFGALRLFDDDEPGQLGAPDNPTATVILDTLGQNPNPTATSQANAAATEQPSIETPGSGPSDATDTAASTEQTQSDPTGVAESTQPAQTTTSETPTTESADGSGANERATEATTNDADGPTPTPASSDLTLASDSATPDQSPIPVPTETPILVPTETAIPEPTETPIPVPTETPIPAPTETPVPVPTETPIPEPTVTPIPVPTETPIPEPTVTPVQVPTETPIPVPTETPIPESTVTPVPVPTETPIPVPTETPVPVPTETPVPVPTETPVQVPTETPIPAPTETPIPESTVTPVPVPTETPVPEPTVTPIPESTVTPIPESTVTPVPEPTETSVPVTTETPIPEPTETPVPDAQPTVVPILPSDGMVDEDPNETPEATVSINNNPEATAEPTSESPVSTDEATETPDETPDQQIIEPVDGETPVSGGDDGGGNTGTGGNGDDPAPSDGSTDTPEAGTQEPSDASSGEDLGSGTEIQQPGGDPGARLALDSNQTLILSSDPGRATLDQGGLTLSGTEVDSGTSLAICGVDQCTDVTSDLVADQHTDTPLGWAGGTAIYQRTGPAATDAVEIRAIDINVDTEEVGNDRLLASGPDSWTPAQAPFAVNDGLLIAGSSTWIFVTPNGVRDLGSNPYGGDVQLVRIAAGLNQIAYVGGGEILIASLDAPGSPVTLVPFNGGIDFDLSPDGQQIVVSTGSTLEIYGLDGGLIATLPNEGGISIGSVIWLNAGIVYVDLTNGVIRQVAPPA